MLEFACQSNIGKGFTYPFSARCLLGPGEPNEGNTIDTLNHISMTGRTIGLYFVRWGRGRNKRYHQSVFLNQFGITCSLLD